jgi:four helix bundle protein
MFIPLNHKNLDVYKVSHEMLLECYKITKQLPPEERYILVSQIRRASLSVKLILPKAHPGNHQQKENDFMKLRAAL